MPKTVSSELRKGRTGKLKGSWKKYKDNMMFWKMKSKGRKRKWQLLEKGIGFISREDLPNSWSSFLRRLSRKGINS